jgi:hypothetical protein
VPTGRLGVAHLESFWSRIVGRLPSRHELTPAIVEMLGQLFDDLLFARRRDRELRQARPDIRSPVTSRLRSR